MAEVGRRNGVYGGWTRARKHPRLRARADRAQAAVRRALERLERQRLEARARRDPDRAGPRPLLQPHAEAADQGARHAAAGLRARPAGIRDERPADPSARRARTGRRACDAGCSTTSSRPRSSSASPSAARSRCDLAAAYPAAVDRLVLVGPTFDPEARSTGGLALRWARNAPRSSPRLAPTIVHDFIDAGPWRSVRTLRRALDDPIEDKLSEIEAKTLVIRPSGTTSYPRPGRRGWRSRSRTPSWSSCPRSPTPSVPAPPRG